MPKMNFDELNAALDACIEAGIIYNVDFQQWKTYEATRPLEADIKFIKDALYLPAVREKRESEKYTHLSWQLVSISIITFPSKKLIAALNDMPANDPFAIAVNNIVAKWQPIADKFKTLKPMIQKGRKPSTDPRKTPQRTFENTGTCACCGKNVKMKDGKMVDHGFSLSYGFRNGNCFGVGFRPIEVSDEGLHALKNALINFNRNAQERLIRVIRNDNTENRAFNLRNTQRDIKYSARDVINLKDRIMKWKPTDLPT